MRLAEEAVQLASQTVDIVLHADALVDLATVLRAVGREDDAGPPIREALQLYEQKGAVAAVLQTRRAWRTVDRRLVDLRDHEWTFVITPL